jgi:hypothetical protein
MSRLDAVATKMKIPAKVTDGIAAIPAVKQRKTAQKLRLQVS